MSKRSTVTMIIDKLIERRSFGEVTLTGPQVRRLLRYIEFIESQVGLRHNINHIRNRVDNDVDQREDRK